MIVVVIWKVLTRAARGTTRVLLILAVSVLVFGFLGIYYAERDKNDDFATLGDCIWLAIVTMSTVGYGDKIPAPGLGKVIASVTMIGGPILLVSLVGSVAVLFYEEWRRVVTGMSRVVSKGHIIVCGWNSKARGILKKCVNSQAVYPLSEQHGLKARERRYTAHEEGKHWE